MERFLVSDQAEERYGGLDAIMELKEQALAEAAQATPATDGQGDPPVAIERWVELEVAQACGVEQGREAQETLASFDLSPADWENINAWWTSYYNQHVMEHDQALRHHYQQLVDHYRAHYGAPPE